MAADAAPLVRLRGVRVAYGARTALDGVDLDLRAGQVTTVIGPNGSGKSTLLGVVCGLVPASAGTVGRGTAPGGGPVEVAAVLQHTDDNRLLPLTVREVVLLGRYRRLGLLGRVRAKDRAAVEAAMARTAVEDLAGRPLRELSGGQRQRVLVAQGLVQQAQVLLLDEPVTGLDLLSRRLIDDAVAGERDAGRAVVLSTHDLADAWRADQAVLLAGRVVAAGAPADVLVDRHLHDAYGSQLLRIGGALALDDGHLHHDLHQADGHAAGAHDHCDAHGGPADGAAAAPATAERPRW
jgi:ABC-type Mn2+/Zn2+ transport system ATPase subunit